MSGFLTINQLLAPPPTPSEEKSATPPAKPGPTLQLTVSAGYVTFQAGEVRFQARICVTEDAARKRIETLYAKLKSPPAREAPEVPAEDWKT